MAEGVGGVKMSRVILPSGIVRWVSGGLTVTYRPQSGCVKAEVKALCMAVVSPAANQDQAEGYAMAMATVYGEAEKKFGPVAEGNGKEQGG